MPPPAQLDIRFDTEGVLTVAGEVDLRTCTQLEETIRPLVDTGGHVVVDLAAMEFCDSTGVAAFVRLHTCAETAGGRLVLTAVPPRFRRTLAMTGVDQLLHLR